MSSSETHRSCWPILFMFRVQHRGGCRHYVFVFNLLVEGSFVRRRFPPPDSPDAKLNSPNFCLCCSSEMTVRFDKAYKSMVLWHAAPAAMWDWWRHLACSLGFGIRLHGARASSEGVESKCVARSVQGRPAWGSRQNYLWVVHSVIVQHVINFSDAIIGGMRHVQLVLVECCHFACLKSKLITNTTKIHSPVSTKTFFIMSDNDCYEYDDDAN
jgi:hypothetical protein